MATPDHKKQADAEKPSPHDPDLLEGARKAVGKRSRAKAKKVLAKGPATPPPTEPEAKKPPTREELIYGLGLRSQYEMRLETLVGPVASGIFARGAPMPSCDRVLGSFTLEMLELAQTFQGPTLLLVPETSFAAKVKALDTHKTMKGQQDAFVNDVFKENDSGSEKITGWKAVIVEGAKKMEVKKGDNEDFELGERIANRKVARKPSEKGMDRHIYAMLMLEALRKGEPIDEHGQMGGPYTVLDDDHALSDLFVPSADWRHPIPPRVIFGGDRTREKIGDARFRSSVGGDVKL